MLVIAFADNISDSLGIHIYQESEGMKSHNVWISTLTNFFSRFLVSLGFIFIIVIFPLNLATTISIIYGLLVISIISYLIAINRKTNPILSIIEHIIIATIVIFLSKYIGEFIVDYF